MEHYIICDGSYGIGGDCKHTECPYHSKHFDPKPNEWIIAHRINIANMGGKCIEMESGNNV